MKVIIAGSRDIDNYLLVCDAVKKSKFQITEIYSGNCRGIDTLGENYAKEKSIPCRLFPADWNRWGKPAGPRRNEQMAQLADALILIWDGKSKGSGGMLKLAKEYGLKIFELII